MTRRFLPQLVAGLATLAALSILASPASAQQLKGVFHISSGSYFRMIYPGGGKYFKNPYSASADKTYTLLSGGSDGGLRTGGLQPAPSPAFDAHGNSRAGRIIRPTNFAGISFGLATKGGAPSISASGGKLSGQVNAFTAEWNNLTFKQGGKVKGTYNAHTHAYVLVWSSLISGGPFNGFTGYWHLSGKFS
jgi:hypothetical protein